MKFINPFLMNIFLLFYQEQSNKESIIYECQQAMSMSNLKDYESVQIMKM